MGIFLYRQKKYTEALTLFSEGLAFKGGDWGMLTNRGDCHRETNNFLKAL
jgi:Tfp pilus assembly protein PilF